MSQPSPRVRELILRFLRKEASESELAELHAWLTLDRTHAAYFDAVNKLFQDQQARQHFNDEKLKASWNLLQARIEKSEETQTRPLYARVLRSTFFRVAASVCLIALVLWNLIPQKTIETPIAQNTILTNNTKGNIAYTLPDSTTVWLNANSTLEYSPDFLESRHVTLKGEGFFDVRKRHQKNFVVETSTLSIEVKGTRFNVRAYDTDHEKATLEEGEIELTIHGAAQKYSMTPGDQIIINKKQQTVTRERVDPKNFTAWKESQLIFDNTVLADIILKLENRFNVRISIDDSLAQRERLTMTVEGEPLEEILEMIHLSSALNYKIENETIIIYE
ncbi:MAG TPA: FecR domain-containing protein [Chryseosolibacter sp.]